MRWVISWELGKGLARPGCEPLAGEVLQGIFSGAGKQFRARRLIP
jgi:hypothetical protein